MGCTVSSPLKDYYLGLENKKKCNCQCHMNTLDSNNPNKKYSLPVMPDGTLKEDSRIPLTGRQIFLIKRSWKGISRNMCETGINMFLSLFEKNEEVLGFFQGLKHAKTLAELRTCKILENHVKGVMLTIDEAISTLDDADTVIEMLLYVGKTHTRHKGFDPHVFLLLREPFLLAVADTLGDRYSAHMQEVYQKAIDFILSTLTAGFCQQQQIELALTQHKTDDAKERENGYSIRPVSPKENGATRPKLGNALEE